LANNLLAEECTLRLPVLLAVWGWMPRPVPKEAEVRKKKLEMLRQFLVAFLKHHFDFSDWNSKCDDRNTGIYQPFVTQVLESIAVPKTR